MPQFTDQLNRTITLEATPKRIVSLVPSQTELLVDLGLEDRLVGVTKFCVHPTGLRKVKTIIGGTKKFHFDKIDALQPDLIIGNKEENFKEGIEKLAEKYPVWMSDIFNLKDAYQMMHGIGEITGTLNKANHIINEIKKGFDKQYPSKGSAVYLIWQNPFIAVGKNTFIHHILNHIGYDNLIKENRYPELNCEQLKKLQPDWLLLSSEPFPFKAKHILFFQDLLPKTKVQLVDGEMFSWYGSRLQLAPAYFDGFFPNKNFSI